MKKFLQIVICFFLLVSVSATANSQFSKPEFAIKYRQSVMFLMSQHFGRMAAMLNEKSSDNKEAFEDNALLVQTLSRLPWQAFRVPGTDKGHTSLKSSAFQQQDKFNEFARTLENQITDLVSKAKSGDFNAIKTQFGEVAKSCKACHSQFRNR
ncbi:MAG: cytochrome c [Desulfobacterales bacterium]